MDTTHLLQATISLILGFSTWTLRSILTEQKALTKTVTDLAQDQSELRVTIIGINGDNGINGTVKKLDNTVGKLNEKVDDIKDRLTKAGA